MNHFPRGSIEMNTLDEKRLDGTELAASFRTLLQKTGSASKHEDALSSIRSASIWLLMLHQLPCGERIELLKLLGLDNLFSSNLQRYTSLILAHKNNVLHMSACTSIFRKIIHILNLLQVNLHTLVLFWKYYRFIRVRPSNSQDQVLLSSLLRFCSLLVSLCKY